MSMCLCLCVYVYLSLSVKDRQRNRWEVGWGTRHLLPLFRTLWNVWQRLALPFFHFSFCLSLFFFFSVFVSVFAEIARFSLSSLSTVFPLLSEVPPPPPKKTTESTFVYLEV